MMKRIFTGSAFCFLFLMVFNCSCLCAVEQQGKAKNSFATPLESKQKLAASRIRMIVIDVEGVLVTHQIYSDKVSFKVHLEDKEAILRAKAGEKGILFCLFSDYPLENLNTFARDIDLGHAYENPSKKREQLESYKRKKKELIERIAREHNILSGKEIAYITSYTANEEIFSYCGLSICPQNAPDEVKRKCLYVCQNRGGKGAIKEAIDFILTAQHKGTF